MSQITIVAKVVAKKEHIESVRSQLLQLVELTRKEAGCIDYRLHQDNEDPAVFVFYENWESAAAIGGHINSAHYKAYAAAMHGLLEGKEVYKMTGIEPGSES